MTGTIINIITVFIGTTLGMLLRKRLGEHYKTIILHAIGLMTLLIGIQMAIQTQDILIVLASMLMGALSGQALNIDNQLEKFAEKLKMMFSNENDPYFSEGFIAASIIFCVGPMTILGSINDGLSGDYNLLAIKSVLDGFTSIALAATFGFGVYLSIFTVLVIQGGLSLFATVFQGILTDIMITEMSAAGGVIIISIGFVILEIKKIKVANFIPAIFFAPLLVYLKVLIF